MLPIKDTVLHFFYKECIQLEGIFFKSYFTGFFLLFSWEIPIKYNKDETNKSLKEIKQTL